MNAVSIKKYISEQLESEDNIEILEHIKNLLTFPEVQESQIELDENQKESINKAEIDIERGNTFKHSEVKEFFSEWLNK